MGRHLGEADLDLIEKFKNGPFGLNLKKLIDDKFELQGVVSDEFFRALNIQILIGRIPDLDSSNIIITEEEDIVLIDL
jgi:hypothetical protein